MIKLTAKQDEYLLYFATMNGQKPAVRDIAEYFGVSNPAVFEILNTMCEVGVIEKDSQGKASITPIGTQYIKQKFEVYTIISKWMCEELDITPQLAEKSAGQLITAVSEELISRFHEKYIYTLNEKPDPLQLNVDSANVPFVVCKPDGVTLSMGDRGFEKPAIFCRGKKEDIIRLKTVIFEYKPREKNVLKGTLSRLWYSKDSRWQEAVMNEDGELTIPLSALSVSLDGEIGTLRIKVKASVRTIIMPESEALIVFNLREEQENED